MMDSTNGNPSRGFRFFPASKVDILISDSRLGKEIVNILMLSGVTML